MMHQLARTSTTPTLQLQGAATCQPGSASS